MPIISPIGRNSPKTRLLVAVIYTVLAVGAATMVYPFLLMIAGSFKSAVDAQEWDVVPRYFHDDAMLFRKFVEAKYNEGLGNANATYQTSYFSFEKVMPPAEIHTGAVQDWKEFQETHPLRADYRALGFLYGFRIYPENQRLLIQHLRDLCHDDIRRFNETYGTTYEKWQQIVTYPERWTDRYYQPMGEPLGPLYDEVRSQRPSYEFYVVSLDGDFLERVIYPKYNKFKIETLNRAYGTNLHSFAELHLSARLPKDPSLARDWEQYVRTLLHPRFIHLDDSAASKYRDFLRMKYEKIDAFNRIHKTTLHDWSDIALPGEVREAGVTLADFTQFLEKAAPLEAIEIRGPEFEYRKFLAGKYDENLNSLNQAHGIAYTAFAAVPIPALATDWVEMRAHKQDVMREFVTRNYAIVLDYVIRHGRALWNTVIFCALSIFTALLVNPLAAYALSRYQLPSQYKVLFFLMATMAFPGEVTLIPNFLLLKQFNMLNTFWALILPAAANGYSIFLLKGFFDSLPRELYESAQIDGASEWRMFWGVTMALSKPILAVIALGAFTAAYGAFMFALIVCQDEKMWTLMVYLYQLQQQLSSPVVFASLLVAAVPTLLVFVFCQNIIMRGIVVPVEK